MKEFWKWREKNCKGSGIWTTAAYKKAWKAALEWALKNGYINDYGDDIISSRDIEEELNGVEE